MKQTTNPVNLRIEWCRRQSAQARSEPEVDRWHAEADGLRDASMECLTTLITIDCALLRFSGGTCWAFRMGRRCCEPHECCQIHTATSGTPLQASRMGGDVLLGDDR